MSPLRPAILPLALLLAAVPAWAEPAAEYSTGLEYQEGDYFTGEKVEILTVHNRVRARLGRVTLAASLPWHRIEAPGNLVGGGGLLGLPIIVDPTRPGDRDVRRGIGDLRIGAGYALPPVAGFDLSLNGEVKLPTASARRGLGTGRTDVTVGAEASRRVGPVIPYVAVGYTLPGDPEGYDLRDSFAWRGGVAVPLSRGISADLAYGRAESVSPLVPDERRLSTALNASVARGLSLGLYGNAGLSDGAADFGAGLSLGIRLF